MTIGVATGRDESRLTVQMQLHRAVEALRRGDAAQAARLSAALAAATPEHAPAWRILGNAANRLKDFGTAEHAFDQAVRHSSAGSPEQAHDLLSRVEPLVCLARPTDALTCVREAVAIGITDPHDFFLAAMAFSHLGMPADALPLAERATSLDPEVAYPWFILGNARQFLGDIDGAEQAFDQVVRLSRDHSATAFHSLAQLRRWQPDRNHIAAMEGFECRSSQEASRIGYALFKEYDDIGDVDLAWDCLTHGASAARLMESWTDAKEKRTFAAWKAAFPDRLSYRDDMRTRGGPKRIFIVGLPRSGTTLVERILTAHSQVQTIGEVNTFAIAARRLSGIESASVISPEIIAAARKIDPLALADDYARNVAYLENGSDFIIDKRPDNYQYIGLIKSAFPDSIVIVLDRHPMDGLFGAYKRSFAPSAHGWSYAIDDLADHYHNFRSLISHWKKVLDNDLIEVSLEDLIADPDRQIRRLLDDCGLPLEQQCFRPHEVEGAVTTASAVQVRRPINTQGVGAWMPYRRYLAPLQERLIALGYHV